MMKTMFLFGCQPFVGLCYQALPFVINHKMGLAETQKSSCNNPSGRSDAGPSPESEKQRHQVKHHYLEW